MRLRRVFPVCRTMLLVGGASLATLLPGFAPDHAAAARDVLVAETDQRSLQDTCLGRTNSSAAHMVEACTAMLEADAPAPRERAAAHLIRAQAYVQLRDQPRAKADFLKSIELFEGALAYEKSDDDALLKRAVAFQSLGEVNRALDDYNAALLLRPNNVAALIGRGNVLADYKADLGRAIIDFNAAITLQPDNVQALIRRGNAQARQGHDGQALADLDRAISLAPDNAQAHFSRGLVNAGRGQDMTAIADYTRALSIAPTHVWALINRAALYSTANENGNALRDLDKAIALDPEVAVAFYNRGYAHFSDRNYEKVLSDYSEAIKLEPNMPSAYGNRCLIRAITGNDLQLALADCDQALKLAPQSLDTRETRGFIHLKIGDPDTALAEYDIALKANPNRALALYGRGLAQIAKGQTALGEASKAAARSINPNVEQQFSIYGLK